MILLIDNYDSFSYNLYQLIGETNPDIRVIRNDEMTVAEIRDLHPEAIVLSPGPGKPQDAGVCIGVVRELGAQIPILGVCLGHQAIAIAYGGRVTHAGRLMHGKQSMAAICCDSPLFVGLERRFPVARYHSLEASALPEELKVTAATEEGEIMAIEHTEYPVYGLQFHPESILTPNGAAILRNFLNIRGKRK